MKTLIKLLTLMSIITPIVAHACWPLDERKEVDGFSELDGTLILSFKDAVSCHVIVDAKVSISGKQYITDYRGYLSLPMESFSNVMDKRLPIVVRKKGYVDLQTELQIVAGTVLNKRLVMSEVLPLNKVRFVLQWLDKPRDLDLHLISKTNHVSYRNMKGVINKVTLDRDSLNGFGPETITLLDVSDAETYSIFVDNYSHDSNFRGHANLKVYNGDALLHSIDLKPGKHRAIHVLDIKNGVVDIINKASKRP